jgi:glycosyltransferase involved in cell wall biosynthesis
LVLVGDGPEREALGARVAASLRAELVHFTGARDDVPDLLAAFDVFVLTSHSEGLPLVLLEAMATELPVVATAVGGIPDIVEQAVTGYLIEPGNASELTRQLAWLTTRPFQAQQVARCSRQMVLENHSLERMAREYESLYRHVLARAQADSGQIVQASHG